jgi:tetratricopeptide (TPR) repeat protein
MDLAIKKKRREKIKARLERKVSDSSVSGSGSGSGEVRGDKANASEINSESVSDSDSNTEDDEDTSEAHTYLNMGAVYDDQGEYPNALKYYYLALKIYKEKLGKFQSQSFPVPITLLILYRTCLCVPY